MSSTSLKRPVVTLAVAAGLLAAAVTPMAANAAVNPQSAQPTPTVSPAPTTTAQGIIMRDGGVCDPIRHMGC
jgi:hypothetical protein